MTSSYCWDFREESESHNQTLLGEVFTSLCLKFPIGLWKRLLIIISIDKFNILAKKFPVVPWSIIAIIFFIAVL